VPARRADYSTEHRSSTTMMLKTKCPFPVVNKHRHMWIQLLRKFDLLPICRQHDSRFSN
jgi:hypothetical protein